MAINEIDALRRAIVDLDKVVSEYIQSSPDQKECGDALLQLNLAKRDLSVVYDSLSKGFSDIMGDGQESVIHLGNGALIEKKSAYDRRGWQHKEIASAVVDRLVQSAIDIDTGEVLKSPTQIALDLMTYCAPSYWRVKELSTLGINADNYCETGELKTNIIVRKGNKE